MAYRWSEGAGRFTDSRSRFVSESAVRSIVDDVADGASEQMARASERLLSGEMSLATWQAEMQRAIKLAHVSAAVIAHGGAEQMTFSRYGAVGNEIKAQYQYLRHFAAQVQSGEQPVNGQFAARARQYGQVARVTYERTRGRDDQQRGMQSERNVLHPAEHCAECRAQTARGWVPLGSLVPIGQRTCRCNDRCSIQRRREPAEVAA